MSKKVICKSRFVASIYTTSGCTYKTTSMWHYHYSDPKVTGQKLLYKTFDLCVSDIERRRECWPDIFTGITAFRNRLYIAIHDTTNWEGPANKVFASDFKYAEWQLETVPADNVSLCELSKILPYKDFLDFAKDHDLAVTLD